MAAVDDEPAGLIAPGTTLARVRALYNMHSHEHTRNATIVEEWRLFQDATVGSFRVNRWGRDVKETTSLGPLSYQRGIFRGVHWEQNRNGITFTYPGVHEQRDAISDHAFRDPNDDRDVRLVGESVPLSAYVVQISPSGGRREWLFIDKRTGFVIRREYVQRRRRYITTYDDYRLFDGVPEPSRTRTVDSLGNEREQILVSRQLDTTPDVHDVEMPPARRLIDFPERAGAVRLPVRFVNGLAVVRVIVGRRGGYDFVLDSGAAGIVVDPTLVEQQNLERLGQRVGSTLGTFPETTTIVPQVSVGPLRMRNVVARVVTIPFRVDDRTHLAGLLGFDFFADAIVHLNYAKSLAEALPPEHFRPPPDSVPVPLGLDDKTPAVRARAGNAAGRLVLDTGANRSVFETAFAERGGFAPERVASSAVRGMGGYASAEAARVPSFELGGLFTRDLTTDVSNADLGTDDVDGVVGSDLLRSYELWFDYHLNIVYIRRARR